MHGHPLESQVLNKLATQDLNMKGRRCIKAAPSKNSDDYVIKQELDDAIANIRLKSSNKDSVNSNSTKLIKQLLISNFTVPAYTGKFGDELIFLFIQNSIGANVVTWDACFGTVMDLGYGDPNTYFIISFVSDGTRWWTKSISGWQAQ